jgi:hypothetical protein
LGNFGEGYFYRHFGLHDSVVIAANLILFRRKTTAMPIVIAGTQRKIAANPQFGLFPLHIKPQRLSVIFSSFFMKRECLLW